MQALHREHPSSRIDVFSCADFDLAIAPALHSAKRAEAVKATSNAAETPHAPRKRPDGRYDCNHGCANKTACKHLWCAKLFVFPSWFR